MVNDQYWHLIRPVTDMNRLPGQNEAKFQIIERLFSNLGIRPQTVLFATFSPLVLLMEQHYACVVIADKELKTIWGSSSVFLESLSDLTQPADVCLALDEYFTFAETELDQRTLVAELKNATTGYIVTTLQDYKNNTPHKKTSVDSSLNQSDQDFIIVEQNQIDKVNRQNWKNYIYVITDHTDLTTIGPIERRTMYFKQLAKYTSDLGGAEYTIQKNLLYKGYYKKYYEHIITVRFP